MTVGPDNSIWFVDQATNKIGHISHTGVIKGFVIPTAKSSPVSITTGSDGAVWFTEAAASRIGRVVAGPSFTSFALPAGASPRGITAGPDGDLYFVEAGTHSVDKILPGAPHTVSLVAALPAGSGPTRIATGPDGNLWVSETTINKVARVTPGGVVTQVTLAPKAAPSRITAGPDGNIWVAEPGINRIGQITTAATPVLTQIAVGGKPTGIAAGGDGNTMWVSEQSGNAIARVIISPLSVKGFVIPTKASNPGGIVLGGDGNVWFSENAADKIGRLTAVSGHSSYVIVHDNNVTPALQGIALETGSTHKATTVRWEFQDGENHSITDNSGASLFDSGSMGPGTEFAHTFTTAGTFTYNSTVGTAFPGTPEIKVTPTAAFSSGTGKITITAATSYPGGVTTDIQVEVPGASSFTSVTTALNANTFQYTPTNGNGVYKFEVRTTSGGNSTGWSPAARATVS
ncbi:MAG TPA: hypothetical protein VGL44_11285 [Gaiellales bacterium]